MSQSIEVSELGDWLLVFVTRVTGIGVSGQLVAGLYCTARHTNPTRERQVRWIKSLTISKSIYFKSTSDTRRHVPRTRKGAYRIIVN
jgi:hypothetical protein